MPKTTQENVKTVKLSFAYDPDDPERGHCTCPVWGNPADDPYYQCRYCEARMEEGDD